MDESQVRFQGGPCTNSLPRNIINSRTTTSNQLQHPTIIFLLKLGVRNFTAFSTIIYETNKNDRSSVANSVAAVKKKGPAVAPKRGGKKLKYVEAVYEYTAQSEAEHNMAEGEKFVLIKDDPGDGWMEVERGGVTKSVPANYVKVV